MGRVVARATLPTDDARPQLDDRDVDFLKDLQNAANLIPRRVTGEYAIPPELYEYLARALNAQREIAPCAYCRAYFVKDDLKLVEDEYEEYLACAGCRA